MAKALEELIEERKQQAIEREIYEKAILILQYLGRYTSSGEINDKCAQLYSLYFVEKGKQIRVYTPKQLLMFEAYSKTDIRIYRPGEWEKDLEKIVEEDLGFKQK